MDFETYTKLIIDSVAECGYDRFMPSLCIPSDVFALQVLEIDPQPQGDKDVALEWTSAFTDSGRALHCAYRYGDRQVEVVEVTGTDVTDKRRIVVRPYNDDVR